MMVNEQYVCKKMSELLPSKMQLTVATLGLIPWVNSICSNMTANAMNSVMGESCSHSKICDNSEYQ
jgi:hypothetical protein